MAASIHVHSAAAARERGDGNADPPRPVRSRRGHGQPGTAGHEPRRHYCPPPATVEPRCRHMRCEMEEAARGRRRRLQRPARSPRLIRDVTERSMNVVDPRVYPDRCCACIKLVSNICNERIQQEKLEKCRDDSQTTDMVSATSTCRYDLHVCIIRN